MLEIGYWGIRGLAAPLRMMMEYTSTDFKDIQYSGDDWFKVDKPKLKELSPIINLPYIKDGDSIVTQSTSCFVYLSEKVGLYGGMKDLELLCEIYDFREVMMTLVYAFRQVCRDKDEYNAAVDTNCKKNVPRFLKKYEQVLAMNSTTYLLKDTPVASDFHLWELIDQFEILAKKHEHPSPLAAFPKLSEYYATFRAEPKLAQYFESDAYKLPINDPEIAYFY